MRLYWVIRGGSWRTLPAYARASYRVRNAPANRYEGFGFRCARRVT
jgi:formylglycine-generating enzyme required for sulfatase activity